MSGGSATDILYVGTLPPHAGGSALHAALILSKLTELGHRVRALAPVTAETRAAAETFEARHPSVHVTRYRVPYLSSSRDQLASHDDRCLEGRRIRAALHRLIDARVPDLIITGRESFAWHVPEIARKLDLPSVLFVHGGRTFSGIVARSRLNVPDPLLTRFRMATAVVAVAQHLGDQLRCLGLDRVHTVPNPVDPRVFSPGPKSVRLMAQLGLAPDETVVVHISKLSSVKRPIDLVRAAAVSLKRWPLLKFVVVGDGPCRPSVLNACRKAGIADRFQFVGWLDHHDVPQYLRLADMVALPSESEGQALVYLETQACGRLLIASDIPGAREVIVNRRTGLLFRKGDSDDLARQLVLGAAHPSLRDKIGRAARRSVAGHDVGAVAARYSAILEAAARR